jgi:hypothetical protein
VGKKAVVSHTAPLAGDDQVFSAAFRQSGIIRARDYEHMFKPGLGHIQAAFLGLREAVSGH